MAYFYTIFLLLKLISAIKGELSLEILKFVNGIEEPVSDHLRELAGKELTLICNLVAPHNDSATYYDDELSWGWKHRNVQFKNVADLEHMATNHPEVLHQFLDKSYINQAIKDFHPLFPLDSGTYFCMSLKYKLFKIVQLSVTVGSKSEEQVPYFKAMDESRSDLKLDVNGPLILPKFLCTSDEFTCKSGSPCFGYEYVCDNVKDCKDGSDESVFRCGVDPCAGKRRCSNGRCISEALCCDKYHDPDCDVHFKPLCCSEHLDIDFQHGIPLLHPDDVDYSNDFTDNVHWSTYEDDSPKFRTMWIVIPCIIILVVVIICIVLRQYLARPINRSRSSRSPRRNNDSGDMHRALHADASLPTFDSLYSGDHHIAVVGIQNLDKPPSYDEAVANVAPSAPPCDKIMV